MTGYAVNAVAPQQMYYPTIYSQGASFDPKLVIATVTGTQIHLYFFALLPNNFQCNAIN